MTVSGDFDLALDDIRNNVQSPLEMIRYSTISTYVTPTLAPSWKASKGDENCYKTS